MDDLTETLEQDSLENSSSIKQIFDAANDSVKSATQIFDKCVALKNKLDKQKTDLEEQQKREIEKLKKFKDDAYKALKEKKKEIDDLSASVKQRELELNNEKARLEIDKKKTYEKIRKGAKFEILIEI